MRSAVPWGTVGCMTQTVLPDVLTAARAAEAGITRSRLLSEDYARVAWDRYLPTGSELDVDTFIAVVAAGLADEVAVGGWAAGRLYERRARPITDRLTVFDGALPSWHAGAVPSEPVLVCASRPTRVVVPVGAKVWRSDLASDDVVDLDGIRITSPARTAFDLVRLWPPVPAVVALDRLAHLGVVELDDVRAAVAAHPGWRGVRNARRALEVADAGSESPRESMLRLVWLAARLPRPRANLVVRDADGRFVARTDLIDPDLGVVAEYDGADHSSAGRRRGDATRQEQLEDLGLVVVRAVEPDLASAPARTAWQHRLRMAYGRARRRGPGRWVVTEH